MSHSPKQIDIKIGDIVTAFTSMVRSGLILLIGDRANQYQDDVIRAMEPMTRLIINLHPNSNESVSQECSEDDLRVAVHHQQPEDFLNDVSHHFLNLVVTDCDFSQSLAQRITSMLMEGACWLVLDASDFADISKRTMLEDFQTLNIGSCLLLVKKSKDQAAVRKGGRRARLAGEFQS